MYNVVKNRQHENHIFCHCRCRKWRDKLRATENFNGKKHVTKGKTNENIFLQKVKEREN